jgi:Lrp/AsnC family leucine-responsive transcriptional regulator
MDSIDGAIIQALQQNSRLSMRKLAERVHMTAPAVAERIHRLEEQGIITGYIIRVDTQKIKPMLLAYIDVIMKSSDHQSFLHFVKVSQEIGECHRIAGDACYLLKVEVPNHSILNSFLEALLTYANYRLNMVIASTIKDEHLAFERVLHGDEKPEAQSLRR